MSSPDQKPRYVRPLSVAFSDGCTLCTEGGVACSEWFPQLRVFGLDGHLIWLGLEGYLIIKQNRASSNTSNTLFVCFCHAGKDLSCRSDTDLACIFGKREKRKKSGQVNVHLLFFSFIYNL